MIYRSRYPDVPLPNVGVHDLILAAMERDPSHVAMTMATTGVSITNSQLADRARRLAAGLAGRGFGRGDCLALIAPNCLEYPMVFLAAAMLGGHCALPNPLGTIDELAGQIQRTRSRLVVTVAGLLDQVLPAATRAAITTVVVIGEAAPDTVPIGDLMSGQPLTATAAVDPGALVALPFSSGTSGRPKAVMLTHRNLIANMHQFAVGMPQADGKRMIAVLPFFHIYGLTLILCTSLWRSRPLVVLPRFELESFLQTIATYRVELAPLVPPIMVALAKHPSVDKYDLSSLRFGMTGAAPLGAEVERAVSERLGMVIGQGYGMTEVCGASHLPQLDPAQIRTGAVGFLAANMEARIVDPSTGADVTPGDRGELWLRGPNVMSGYLDEPQATAAAITPDGWLRTGDIAIVDTDGYFSVVDRLKELIKYKAHQVAPADLEAVLLTNPDIADAAVIPSPDDEAGEVPKAFVVAKRPMTAEQVMAYVATRVSPMDKVRRVEFVDAIPKSPSGKILRRVLVEQERKNRGQA